MPGIDDRIRSEFRSTRTAKILWPVCPHNNDSQCIPADHTIPGLEIESAAMFLPGSSMTPRSRFLAKSDFATDVPGLRKNEVFGTCTQMLKLTSGRNAHEDRADMGTCPVDAEVKPKLRRRRVNALPGLMRREIDDVTDAGRLVHPGRSDPHPPFSSQMEMFPPEVVVMS